MPTDPAARVSVGRVGRPHGIDGAFVVEGASEDPARFEVGARLYAAGEPAEIVLRRRVGGARLAIKLDRAVERGSELTVPREELPAPEPGFFYVSDLVGLRVVLVGGEGVGVVRDVLPGRANDSLELDSGVLVPLVQDAVAEIDVSGGRVVLNPGFTD